MPGEQPTVAGRGLGAQLRSIREERKLSTRKAAEHLGWAQSKISKIETGKQAATPTDVASLLAIYRVTGHERDRLLATAETADEPGLWESSGLSRESRTLIQLESEATHITDWEPLLVPGLLQTPEYTRAVMKACGVSPEDIEIRVAARLSRQAILSRDSPPHLEILMDEMALRRCWDSRPLMVRQLRYLLEAADQPHISLRVIALDVGGHSGLDGSFSLLDFATQKSVIQLEHMVTALFLDDAHDIDFFRSEADRLRAIALTPKESLDNIASIVDELGERRHIRDADDTKVAEE